MSAAGTAVQTRLGIAPDMTDEQQQAFMAFVAAARQAQASLTFADAHAAGQAWRIFLNLYAPVPREAPGLLPQALGGWAR